MLDFPFWVKVDCHEVLNHYKQLLHRYFKMFNQIGYVEAYIYKNQKHEMGIKWKYCNHCY